MPGICDADPETGEQGARRSIVVEAVEAVLKVLAGDGVVVVRNMTALQRGEKKHSVSSLSLPNPG